MGDKEKKSGLRVLLHYKQNYVSKHSLFLRYRRSVLMPGKCSQVFFGGHCKVDSGSREKGTFQYSATKCTSSMQTLVHNRDSSWCDAGNLIIRQSCATWHYTGDRIYGRLKFFQPPFELSLEIFAEKAATGCIFLSQADCCQEWVGAPLYVSAYDYLLTIIFFSQPVATFS